MIVLRQKEFGFIQDVRRSGLKRTIKRNIGRARLNLATKLEKSTIKDALELEKLSKDSINYKDIDDSVKELLIAKEVARNNGKTVSGSVGGNSANVIYVNPSLLSDKIKKSLAESLGVRNKSVRNHLSESLGKLNEEVGDLDKGNLLTRYLKDRKHRKGSKKIFDENYEMIKNQISRESNKIENAIKSGKYIVVHTKGSGIVKYAHEAGHVKNANSKNKITKLISETAGSKDARLRNNNAYIKYTKFDGDSDKTGFKNLLRSIRDNASVVLEESNASKKGYKILKDLGLNEEELKGARGFYDTALGTYKKSAKIDIKNSLKNFIAPKSRSGTMLRLRKRYGSKKAREIMNQVKLDYEKYLKETGIG